MNINDIRICFVGDSFVNGTCDPEGLGWVGRLIADVTARDSELTYYNLGVRGDTSQMILARWQAECEKRLPSDSDNRLVFSFGVNDTLLKDRDIKLDYNKTIQNTKKILSIAMSKYKVIMVGPPPVDDKEQNLCIEKLDRAFGTLCSEIGVSYLSVYTSLRDNDIWMNEVSNNDGSHPGVGGYSNLAKLVSNWEKWWF